MTFFSNRFLRFMPRPRDRDLLLHGWQSDSTDARLACKGRKQLEVGDPEAVGRNILEFTQRTHKRLANSLPVNGTLDGVDS